MNLSKLEELLSTVESCYADVVTGDISFGEWTCTFGWGPDRIAEGLEASTACDSLDGTPLVIVEFKDEAAWELALYPEVKVGKPIGCRLPAYKWAMETLRCDTEEADAIGDELWELVQNRKAAMLL